MTITWLSQGLLRENIFVILLFECFCCLWL